MKLDIDWTRCAGHGLCAAVLPERITRDEWGFPMIDNRAAPLTDAHRAEAHRADARRAVALCPALALRLERR